VTRIPRIAKVMTPFPYSIGLDASLRVAREMMVEHSVRHLPVVKGHTLVGIVTERDIKRALDPELGLPPRDQLFVQDVYVPEPYTVDDHTPLDEVLEHMATHRVGSALVTVRGRLAGIFTATDACREFCVHLRKLFPSADDESVA
jgi:acetoin utilization protein AcuB